MTSRARTVKDQTGIYVTFDPSPKRRKPGKVHPVPAVAETSPTYISLALVTMTQAGRKSIRVSGTTTPPGGPTILWFLEYHGYQGATPPAAPTWITAPVPYFPLDYVVADPLPLATYVFRLRSEEGGRTIRYPAATIVTLEDTVAAGWATALDDMVMSRLEKPEIVRHYNELTREYTSLDSEAATWGFSSSTGPRASLLTAWNTLNSTLGALTPAWDNLTVDTPANGPVVRTRFYAVAQFSAELRAAIAVVAKTGLDANTTSIVQQLSDDYQTVPEKRAFKRWYDAAAQERDGTEGLQARADRAPLSRTAYDAAWTAFSAYLATVPGWSGSDWTDYTSTQNLGAGVGVALGNLVVALDAQALDLNKKLSAVAERPVDPVRATLRWDCGGSSDPSGVTVSGATGAAAPSPEADLARRYTATGSRIILSLALAGRLAADAHTVQARVRLVSGTWEGRACPGTPVTAPSSSWSVLAAPPASGWQTVTWDLRTLSNYVTGSPAPDRIELWLSSGVCDVDWVVVGTYGAGSLADQDGALERAIMDLLAQGNVSVLQNLIVANLTNLIPNADSELAKAKLPPGSWGLVGLDQPSSYAYQGTGSRRVQGGQRLQLTPRIQATPGDWYAAYAFGRTQAVSGTSLLELEAFDSSGASLGVYGSAVTSATVNTWQELAVKAQVPANAFSFALYIRSTAPADNGGAPAVPYYSYFDRMSLRKAADARLLVDGDVVAERFQTSNYAEDAFGTPTAGAKLERGATAGKFGPEGINLAGKFLNHVSFRLERVRNGRFQVDYYRRDGIDGWTGNWWADGVPGGVFPGASYGHAFTVQTVGPQDSYPGATTGPQNAARLSSGSVETSPGVWDSRVASAAAGVGSQSLLTQVISLPDRPPAAFGAPVMTIRRKTTLQAGGTARLEVSLTSGKYGVEAPLLTETLTASSGWTTLTISLPETTTNGAATVPCYYGAGDYLLQVFMEVVSGTSCELLIADVSVVL